MELLNPQSAAQARLTLYHKGPVRVASDLELPLTGVPGGLVDGVSLNDGDRILLTNQTDKVENGIWIVRSGAWERPADFLTGSSAGSVITFSQEGSTYADEGWLSTANSGFDVVDTHPLDWALFTGGGGSGPGGAAGGDLDGTYPNPDVVAVHSDGARLPIGSMLEGQFLRRFGNEISSSPTGVWVEEVYAATNGQTVFILAKAPLDANSFRLTVNGVVYAEGVDFTLAGDTVTWLNIPFVLQDGDEVVVKYLDLLSIVAGSLELGVPSDGTFADGLLPITPTTTIADGIDAINEVLKEIVPAPPGSLDGQSLVLSVSSYSARLPYGLTPNWNPYVPGDVISGLVFNSFYTLASPDQSSRFPGGLWNESPLGDRVYHVLDGADLSSRLIQDGVGVTGSVEILSVTQYNSIWRRINARLLHNQTEGQDRHRMRADGTAGQTDVTTLFYDDLNDAPSFSASPSNTVIGELLRYLSGVPYYREGTVIGVSYVAAEGIFRKHYHASAVSQIAMPGASALTVNPPSIPSVNDVFSVSNAPMTIVSGSVAVLNPSATVTLRKANQSTAQTTALSRGINTYAAGGSSTTKDIFVDELQRLVLGTSTPWTSTAPLVQGNAQVQNGVLVHGNDGDYPGHLVGSDADYERIFVVGTQSGGVVRLGGILASSVSQYGTGTLNIFLLLEGNGLWFDLGLSSPFINGTGDGSSLANSIGAKFGAAGGDLTFTLAAPASGGPYSTGGVNLGQYRLRIRYRGASGLSLASVEAL